MTSDLFKKEKKWHESKTIKSSFAAASFAVGGVLANMFIAHSTEISAFLASILPITLAGFVPLIIQAITATLTSVFAKKAIDGRIEASTKIAKMTRAEKKIAKAAAKGGKI